MKNVGLVDRNFRFVFSFLLIADGISIDNPLGLVFIVIGLFLVLTAILRFCPLWRLFRMNTTRRPKRMGRLETTPKNKTWSKSSHLKPLPHLVHWIGKLLSTPPPPPSLGLMKLSDTLDETIQHHGKRIKKREMMKA